jgi:hypothetical protein
MEEGLLWRRRLKFSQVLDRLVRHIGCEVVTGLPDPRGNLRSVFEQIRCPLIGLTAHEPIEVLESHADRPLFERTSHRVLKARVLWFLPNHDVA